MREERAAPRVVSASMAERTAASITTRVSTAPAAIPLPGPSTPLDTAIAYVNKVAAITTMEVQKLMHNQWDVITRSVQPILWLILFGGVFGRLRVLPPGYGSYLDFVTPGILAQSVLTIAIFQGIMVIWERDQGTLQKFLVSPMPRSALVLGKGFGSAVKGTIQAFAISIIALFMGVDITRNPLAWLGVLLIIVLGANCFATISLIIAALVRDRERVQGLGQLIMMPLFFASNALYPIAIMPPFVATIASLNPLSYMVDGLRDLMINGAPSHYGLGTDFAVLIAVNLVVVGLAARLYPRVVQ